MIDLSKYRQVKVEVFLPDGTKSTNVVYVDIDTNEVVESTVLQNETVETITITCATVCVVE